MRFGFRSVGEIMLRFEPYYVRLRVSGSLNSYYCVTTRQWPPNPGCSKRRFSRFFSISFAENANSTRRAKGAENGCFWRRRPRGVRVRFIRRGRRRRWRRRRGVVQGRCLITDLHSDPNESNDRSGCVRTRCRSDKSSTGARRPRV